jgi:hypothetical protein
MIKDLIKIKVPSVTSTLSFNVLLHVTILFTILSVFFTKYVSKISSNIINNEIKHIIDDGIEKSSEEINKIKNKLSETITLQNNLIEQFENTENINDKLEIKEKIQQTFNTINELTNQIFPYDYYVNLFSKEDITRQSINNEVFFYIKFTNILLIIFLGLFTFYLVKTNAINSHQIKEICLENILTFMLVGLVEFLFFKNVAMKYIPTEPSLIFTSFFGSLNKLF